MKRKKPNSPMPKKVKVSSKGKDRSIEPVLPKKQSEHKSKGTSLVLIKKTQVTFKLSRLENHRDFELMSFVVKACDKANDYPVRTVLHVEQTRTGSRLVACDGARLHAAEISKKIKSGNYKPHVSKDTITLGEPEKDIEYPEWIKNIPENAEKQGVINLEKSGLGKDREENENLSIAFNSFVKQTGETINLRHLDDLTKSEWTIYSHNGDRKLIVLRQQSKKAGEAEPKYPVAVIMPIKQAA
jgi:hypothetical protein